MNLIPLSMWMCNLRMSKINLYSASDLFMPKDPLSMIELLESNESVKLDKPYLFDLLDVMIRTWECYRMKFIFMYPLGCDEAVKIIQFHIKLLLTLLINVKFSYYLLNVGMCLPKIPQALLSNIKFCRLRNSRLKF